MSSHRIVLLVITSLLLATVVSPGPGGAATVPYTTLENRYVDLRVPTGYGASLLGSDEGYELSIASAAAGNTNGASFYNTYRQSVTAGLKAPSYACSRIRGAIKRLAGEVLEETCTSQNGGTYYIVGKAIHNGYIEFTATTFHVKQQVGLKALATDENFLRYTTGVQYANSPAS
jgi:hypothetical protein